MNPTPEPPDAARRGLKRTAARAGAVARAALLAIRAARPVLRTIVQALLALVIVFEEWGWQPLAALLARLGRLQPVAALEARIATLPPYPALAVFALPSLLILPLKLIAIALIAGGHALAATLLFVGAKVVGTALVARIFQLTQPALMRLAWFARAYGAFMPWKHALTEWVRASWAWRYGRIVKRRVREAARAAWARWRPAALALAERLKTGWRGR